MAGSRLENDRRRHGGVTSLSAFTCPGTLHEFARERNAGEQMRRIAFTLLSGQTRNATVWGTAPVRRRGRRAGPGVRTPRGVALQTGLSVDTAGLPDEFELTRRFRLTAREAEVALLLAQRRTNKEIARTLDVTTHTARRHTERVLGKLGINSRRHVLPAITTSSAAAEA